MTSTNSVPAHVGIIMDGNGRWAEKRGLTRTEGHRAGVRVVHEITQASVSYGIGYLTLFAFSTENWKRSYEEVNFLFNLFVQTIQEYLPQLKENSVRLNFIGDVSSIPLFVRTALARSAEETHNGNKMVLNVAINYGSRNEIVNAVRTIIKLEIKDINEESFKNYLYTADQPDPDLIIRTGGEKRLSNFLLYQSIYSEIFFTETLWPDFTREEYYSILEEFSHRKRRFGGL